MTCGASSFIHSPGYALATAAFASVALLLAPVLVGLLQTFLFEITPTDPWTYAAAAAVVLLVALAACLAPALRATRMSPMAALKTN